MWLISIEKMPQTEDGILVFCLGKCRRYFVAPGAYNVISVISAGGVRWRRNIPWQMPSQRFVFGLGRGVRGRYCRGRRRIIRLGRCVAGLFGTKAFELFQCELQCCVMVSARYAGRQDQPGQQSIGAHAPVQCRYDQAANHSPSKVPDPRKRR